MKKTNNTYQTFFFKKKIFKRNPIQLTFIKKNEESFIYLLQFHSQFCAEKKKKLKEKNKAKCGLQVVKRKSILIICRHI